MSKEPSPGRKILFAFAAGQVRRWHTAGHVVRQQNVSEHSHGVATWISLLHPDPSARLLKAALHHDLAELRTGDPTRYVKQSNPELRKILEHAEAVAFLQYGLQGEKDLTEDEICWLHGADLLDAWLFLLQNIVGGNEMVRGDFNKAAKEMRRRNMLGEYPDEVRIAMEQILAAYSWIHIW